MEHPLTNAVVQLPQTMTTTELIPCQGIPADRNPALVYLASLAAGSRRTMRQALNTVAQILTAGRCDLVTLPWGAIRFQHTQAVRTALQERYNGEQDARCATPNPTGGMELRLSHRRGIPTGSGSQADH